jgi:protein SCO1/2
MLAALLFLAVGGSVLALAIRHRNETPAVTRVQVATAPASSAAVAWEPIKSFTLTGQTGKEFNSELLTGKVWAASFFFSSCPFSCREQNQRFGELHQEYGPKGVKFLSITCDPTTDTPDRLAQYAATFNADPNDWLLLTGELGYIRRIGGEMLKVAVEEKFHSEKFILVDQEGNIRGYYNWKDPLEVSKMKQMMDDLLAGTAPPIEEPEPQAATGAES